MYMHMYTALLFAGIRFSLAEQAMGWLVTPQVWDRYIHVAEDKPTEFSYA